MAESGGHWSTLAEAQKLTQSTLIPGVIEIDIKRGNPVDRIPVAQAANAGKSIKFVMEATGNESSVSAVDIGEQLSWSEDVTYTEVEKELKRLYIQRKLDQFVRDIYGNINNYRAQVVLEMEKGLKRKIGDKMIYGDLTYAAGNADWDGLHAIAAEHGATPGTGTGHEYLNIDQAHVGLSLKNMRDMEDAGKAGWDEIWMPFNIMRWFDAAYQERGINIATPAANVLPNMAMISFGWNEMGKRVAFWDGIPIVRTDYLVAEQYNTGTGATSDARAKYTSGTANYSIFFLKFGNVMARQPGITFAYGGTEGAGDLYKLVLFPNLEEYDAEGLRMVTYGAMLWGSTFSVGRIFDIYDIAITV